MATIASSDSLRARWWKWPLLSVVLLIPDIPISTAVCPCPELEDRDGEAELSSKNVL
jgi:hypothetical protein